MLSSNYLKNWKHIAGVAVIVSIVVLLIRALTHGWTIPDLLENTDWVRVSATVALAILICAVFEGTRSMGVVTTQRAAALFGILMGLIGTAGSGLYAALENESLGNALLRGMFLVPIVAVTAWTIFVLGERSEANRHTGSHEPR